MPQRNARDNSPTDAAIGATGFDLARLRAQIKPFRLHWLTRLRSTNDHAAAMRRRGELFAPAMVLTGRQIAGRGRNSNTWWSGAGSITVTFVLPIDDLRSPQQLPLVAGLATRNAVAGIAGGEDIKLKWPNDLLYRGRKLAGLLCERVHKADLIGLGLNVNADAGAPRALQNRIIALSEIAKRELDKTSVLIAVVKQLYPMLSRRNEHPFGMILREYGRHHALMGQRVSISDTEGEFPTTGICTGIDSMGRLLVRVRGGQIRRVIAGQVNLH